MKRDKVLESLDVLRELDMRRRRAARMIGVAMNLIERGVRADYAGYDRACDRCLQLSRAVDRGFRALNRGHVLVK